MLWITHVSPSFAESRPGTPGKAAQPASSSLQNGLAALRIICGALPEGLAAYREYEHLRSRHIPRTAALPKALGINRGLRS